MDAEAAEAFMDFPGIFPDSVRPAFGSSLLQGMATFTNL